MEIKSVNEGTQTHIDGKKAAGAERKLERRRDEEEADKTREAGQDKQSNLVAWAEERAAAAESEAPAWKIQKELELSKPATLSEHKLSCKFVY